MTLVDTIENVNGLLQDANVPSAKIILDGESVYLDVGGVRKADGLPAIASYLLQVIADELTTARNKLAFYQSEVTRLQAIQAKYA